MNLEIKLNNTVNKTQIEFNYYIQKEDCLDKLPMETVIRDNAKCGNSMKS